MKSSVDHAYDKITCIKGWFVQSNEARFKTGSSLIPKTKLTYIKITLPCLIEVRGGGGV